MRTNIRNNTNNNNNQHNKNDNKNQKNIKLNKDCFITVFTTVTTVNCLYNTATNGMLPEESVTQMSFMDAVSLYSSMLSLTHPVENFVIMDSDQNPSLFEFYSNRIMDYDTEFFVQEKQLRHHLFIATVQVSHSPQLAKWHSLGLRTTDDGRISIPRAGRTGPAAKNQLNLFGNDFIFSICE